MNLSLLDMLNGNTSLEDLANLRELWVEPRENLMKELEDVVEAERVQSPSPLEGIRGPRNL